MAAHMSDGCQLSCQCTAEMASARNCCSNKSPGEFSARSWLNTPLMSILRRLHPCPYETVEHACHSIAHMSTSLPAGKSSAHLWCILYCLSQCNAMLCSLRACHIILLARLTQGLNNLSHCGLIPVWFGVLQATCKAITCWSLHTCTS